MSRTKRKSPFWMGQVRSLWFKAFWQEVKQAWERGLKVSKELPTCPLFDYESGKIIDSGYGAVTKGKKFTKVSNKRHLRRRYKQLLKSTEL